MMRDIYINSNLEQLTKSVPVAEPPSSKMSSYKTSLKWPQRLCCMRIVVSSVMKRGAIFWIIFFNWDLLHAWQNLATMRHGVTRKRSTKRLKAYRKSVQKEPRIKMCLLILGLKPLVQRKTFYRKRILESSCARKESKEAREGAKVLYICFCNLSDNFK